VGCWGHELGKFGCIRNQEGEESCGAGSDERAPLYQLEVILRYRDHRESCRPRRQRLEGICLHSVLGCLDSALLGGNEQEAHHASRSAKGSDRDSLKELEEPPPHSEAKTERN
jgi:hypothetical protein